MKKMESNNVMCDVSNCKYNDNNLMMCSLKKIKISSVNEGNKTHDKKETICDSFNNNTLKE